MSAANFSTTELIKLTNFDEVKPVLEKFKNLESINGLKITKKDFKDGVKLYLEDNESWILVRPSGTEPLLRIYFESGSRERINELELECGK